MVRTRRFVQSQRTEGGQDAAENPLLNDAVLEHFFGVIPFRCADFKNFRLVSKQWRSASLQRWRRCAWLSIGDSRYFPDYSYLHINSCLKMISTPGDPYELLGANHFQKYKIRMVDSLTWGENFCRGKGRHEFWTAFGSLMTHLKVVDSKIFSCSEVQRILLEMTPNLEYLSYDNNRILERDFVAFPLTLIEWNRATEPVWNGLMPPQPAAVLNNLAHLHLRCRSDFPISWVYFLARFPNIQTLRLDGFTNTYRMGSGFYEFQLFFKSIRCIRERCNPGCLRNLQELDILNSSEHPLLEFPPDVLSIIRELAFPLSVLALDIGVDKAEERLKIFLGMYAKTLQKLMVFRGPYWHPFGGTFPLGVNLPFLTVLKLIGPICTNLHFLRNTPLLKVLVIMDGTRYEVEDKLLRSYLGFSIPTIRDERFLRRTPLPAHPVISSTDFYCEEMENLVLSNVQEFVVGHELCSGQQVEQLGKLFPNLKKVRLGMDDSGFTEACRAWKQLEYLDVEPFDIGEIGLLGIENGQMYSQANLTDFKFLSHFRMGHHSRNRNEARLTNSSILHGLLVTPCLKEVYFSVYPQDYSRIRAMLFAKFPQS